VKALEDLLRLQQIDGETFVKLRRDILGDELLAEVEKKAAAAAGPELAKTKGLDFELLAKARRGEVRTEDVLEGNLGKEAQDQEDEDQEDLDDEFERLEDMDVEAVVKDKAKKKGEMAPTSKTGRKRNRDQILAEMKAARLAAKGAARPSLGSRFKKVGKRRAESRIERDSKGREVLITVDDDGNEKRKVRKIQVQDLELEKGHGLLMPDKDAKPLGMVVPDIPKPVEEEADDDIFGDVGDDYDPLAGLSGSDSGSEEGEEGEVLGESKSKQSKKENKTESPALGSMAPPPRPNQPPAPRNYFGDSKPEPSEDPAKPKALTDPTFLAALKKASSLNPISQEPSSAEEAAKAAKHKKMLQQDDRDAQDMDMGFGSSRFEDEADFEDSKIKLSEWGDDGDNDGGGKGGKGNEKRKRGGKKRKGNVNNAADVLGVLARRKAAEK
jgi:hypothetical protein